MKERLDKIINLMQQTDILNEQVQRISELEKRYSENELIVSVIGQFKRGKSSFTNTIIGEEILPVGIVPLTTVVTEIRRGNDFKAIVCFLDGTQVEVTRENLSEYISEQKNKNNNKKVASVKLWVRSELFGEGITIVDTPGVGSVHQHNTDTSYSFIEKSDAVIFLLSVDSPVSEIEREFLLKTRDFASKFYFAVNKIDTVSPENLEEFISYCNSILSETVGFNVELYPISTITGDGIAQIKQKISNDIQSSYGELLSISISNKLENIIKQAKSEIELYLKSAAIPAEELEIKISEIKTKQAMLSNFLDEVQVLTKVQTERLVENIKENLNWQDALINIKKETKQFYENSKQASPKQFENEITKTIEGLLRKEINNLNKTGLELLNEGYKTIVSSLNNKAVEIAEYISQMVRDSFGIEYPVNFREFSVSERSDYFVRLSNNGSLHLDVGNLTYLLPGNKIKAKIYERALEQAEKDLQLNINNMIYNYRYKMQESLRTLCSQMNTDIINMNAELSVLLTHMENNHKTETKELNNISDRYMKILLQLNY